MNINYLPLRGSPLGPKGTGGTWGAAADEAGPEFPVVPVPTINVQLKQLAWRRE